MTARTGWTRQPAAFAAMNEFMAGTGFNITGFDVDATGGVVWSRITGDPEEIVSNYRELQAFYGTPGTLALPWSYADRTKPTDDSPKLLAPWDSPLIAEAVGPGWLGSPITNNNPRSLGLVWAASNRQRAVALLPSDAPGILAVHKSGAIGSLLQVWHALRDDLTAEFFKRMAAIVERDTGQAFDMDDVFVVCVPGARMGFGIRKDGRDFLTRMGDYSNMRSAYDLDGIFETTIYPVVTRDVPGAYPPDKCPFDLDLGMAAYRTVVDCAVNHGFIPNEQVLFDPRCSMTTRNREGVLVRGSKRTEQAGTGKRGTCITGFAINVA